ncbi:hypothetical protein NDU88_001158 [Pleurodeles waltl]|uniref:DRBM domain-containing protein n=1 Tax=Pleurodeles waltl TaxID=8319 RepID=A0AAV7LYQ4_PLEWA|nr:hypothetical protein NDU88_001158 [Pleurodeles waltl]
MARAADATDESKEDLVEKNVVQLIYEHSRQTKEPVAFEWDFVGTTSQPGFICRATIGDAVYIGAGSSKKAAKYSAAKAAVEARESYASATNVLTPDGQNPITVLNDLVARRKLLLPDYVVIDEGTGGRGGTFTVVCMLGSLMEKGSGPCKSIAKQAASLKMLEKLKREEIPQDPLQDPFPYRSVEPLSTAPGRGNNTRSRVSPYPSTNRPFPENRRGGSAQYFNTAPDTHEQYPQRPLLANTEPIRPMELRQGLFAQEMHIDSEYGVRGAFNTGTTMPPMTFNRGQIGNGQYPLTQEYNREPIAINRGQIGNGQYPLTQEYNREPIAHAQYPVAQVIPDAGPIRPRMELRQDYTASEMHPAPVHNTQHQWGTGPLNTDTIRPLGNNHSAQERGGNARLSLTPASFSSGLVRVLLASQQDLDTQGSDLTEGCDEEYIWARVSKITGMAALFLEQKADLKSKEMNTGRGRKADLSGTFVTLKPAGMLELPLEQPEGPSSPEQLEDKQVEKSLKLQLPTFELEVKKPALGPEEKAAAILSDEEEKEDATLALKEKKLVLEKKNDLQGDLAQDGL